MYKDMKGNYINIHSVVMSGESLYSVEGFDTTREYCVRLRNGCLVSYNKPENLICVTYTWQTEEEKDLL